MSEYSQYLESFNSGYWVDENPNNCRCRGSGWALSELDTWHQCPIHFNNQHHPEYEPCPECEDGQNYSPRDCPNCQPTLNDDSVRVCDNNPSTDDQIPF